jgi:hypothetical protein
LSWPSDKTLLLGLVVSLPRPGGNVTGPTAAPCPANPRGLTQIKEHLYRHTTGPDLAVHSGLVLITSEGALVIDPAMTCTDGRIETLDWVLQQDGGSSTRDGPRPAPSAAAPPAEPHALPHATI